MFAAFNTINSYISRLDSDAPSEKNINPDTSGFRVLRNLNADLKIEPWFDFIVGINGRQITDPDVALLLQEIQNSSGSLSLTVFSAKGAQYRELHFLKPPLPLGLTLQYSPFSLTQDIYHVLSISTSSPADEAGLLPYSDYILGSPDGRVRGENGLAELVEAWLDRELTIWVYNHEFDVMREVKITPNRRWGGEGVLGCTLGYGALHRVPAPLTEGPVPERGETFFESDKFGFDPSDEDFLIPASDFKSEAEPTQIPFFPTAPPTSTSPATGRTKGGKKARASNKMLDSYFEEGEKQSLAIDHAPSPVSGIAPPPKAGGTPGEA